MGTAHLPVEKWSIAGTEITDTCLKQPVSQGEHQRAQSSNMSACTCPMAFEATANLSSSCCQGLLPKIGGMNKYIVILRLPIIWQAWDVSACKWTAADVMHVKSPYHSTYSAPTYDAHAVPDFEHSRLAASKPGLRLCHASLSGKIAQDGHLFSIGCTSLCLEHLKIPRCRSNKLEDISTCSTSRICRSIAKPTKKPDRLAVHIEKIVIQTDLAHC